MPNYITGTSGPDTIIGTDGDDNVDALGGNDSISTGKGNDVVQGFSNLGDDTIDGGAGNDRLDGGEGNDSVFGGAGNDVLFDYVPNQVPNGNDSYNGGAGIDTIVLTRIFNSADSLVLDLRITTPQDTVFSGIDSFANIENVLYIGTNPTIHGNASDNTLTVSGGQIALWGHEGNDRFLVGLATGSSAEIDGGTGSDTFLFNGGPETDYYSLGEATNRVGYTLSLARDGQVQQNSAGSLVLRSVENLVGSWWNDRLTGNREANLIAGNYGHDTLIGGAGDDQLYGDGRYRNVSETGDGALRFLTALPTRASGDDVLNGGTGDDLLNGGFGHDTASYAHASGSVIASLVLNTSSGADGNDTLVSIENLIGSSFSDALTGDGGNNRIDGGGSGDVMVGGAGDDTYMVDSAADNPVEEAGGGTDTIESTISWTLDDNLENLTLIGTGAIDATGNDAANRLQGNSAANVLTGQRGDDVYVVDSADDRVVEQADEGIDRVETSASYVLADNVENLTLTGRRSISGTGNALGNTLIGTVGNNALDGMAGADRMEGGRGDDTYYVDDAGDIVIEESDFNRRGDTVVAAIENYRLPTYVERLVLADGVIAGRGNAGYNEMVGNAADNVLNDGGGGNDTQIGGAGNDTYLVRSAFARIIEQRDGGTDTALVSQPEGSRFVMGAYLENAAITGRGGTVVGNALANVLSGSSRGDQLEGEAGADTLSGLGGNDLLYGGLGNDVIDGGVGSDKLFAGAGNDTLTGGAGNDLLVAAAGRDQLTGGSGSDVFVLNSSGTSRTTITDFAHGADRILIATDIITGALDPAAFHLGTRAATETDRVIYDEASHRLWFDADGSGIAATQILVATLQDGAVLDASDIGFVSLFDASFGNIVL